MFIFLNDYRKVTATSGRVLEYGCYVLFIFFVCLYTLSKKWDRKGSSKIDAVIQGHTTELRLGCFVHAQVFV